LITTHETHENVREMRTILKAIETHYAGRRFRSRLEARWAVFFDAAGITWQYEPEGFEGRSGFRYLPDFYLPYVDNGVYFEVKGEFPFTKKNVRYQVDVVGVLPKAVIFAVGDVPGDMELWVEDKSGALWNSKGTIIDARHIEECEALWSSGSRTEKRADYLFPEAIRAARSARFEHGEAP
jgi:hypothetical protein